MTLTLPRLLDDVWLLAQVLLVCRHWLLVEGLDRGFGKCFTFSYERLGLSCEEGFSALQLPVLAPETIAVEGFSFFSSPNSSISSAVALAGFSVLSDSDLRPTLLT